MWTIALGLQVTVITHLIMTWHLNSKLLDRPESMTDELAVEVRKVTFRIQIAISLFTGALASQLIYLSI